MEKKLHSIFWTTIATNLSESILKNSYKVLPKKVKIATYQEPLCFMPICP